MRKKISGGKKCLAEKIHVGKKSKKFIFWVAD